MSPTTTQVLLIEDHSPYREAVRDCLDATDDFTFCAGFSTLEAALEHPNNKVDIILLDLGLPGMGGIEGIGPLRELFPKARIIILTAFPDREKVFAALEAGAHGYLLKSATLTHLMHNLREVATGGTPLDPQIAGMILKTFQKLSPIVEDDNLSPREIEVLQYVAKGFTKQQVADELLISHHSVSGYLRRAFDKLHVHSLPAAVSAAIRRGLLDLS